MPKKLDPKLIEIFKRYNMNAQDCLWDCHGTWVAYHKAIEEIGAYAGVSFSRPEILEADSAKKIAAVLCFGKLGEREEWSVGECSPANNKNAYPYAMAEKRAKDRVILKLVGLHGHVYSEEESDDFKPKSSAQLKKDGVWDDFINDLNDCQSTVALEALRGVYRIKAQEEGWNKPFLDNMKEEFEKKETELDALGMKAEGNENAQ